MKCHYVPRAHLLRFCEPTRAPLIRAYDKLNRRFLEVSVHNIALEKRYYPPDTEKELAMRVEEPANKVIDSLLLGRAISQDQRIQLALHVAVMLKRVPAGRKRAQAMLPGVLKDTIREFVGHVRRLVDEDGLDPVIAEFRIDEAFEIQEKFTRKPPPELSKQVESPWLSQNVVATIASMRWRIMTTDGPLFFITTDNPAFFFSSYGVGNPESELSFPLSFRAALLGNRQGTEPLAFVKVSQSMVKEVNRRLASEATRFLFYPTEAKWLETLALKQRPHLSRILW